ncbi:MAG: hypothetical protein LIQ31_02080 [Planctomycetes bacterium]|nr:hypothetical protein [Planctomycetota bacterium]
MAGVTSGAAQGAASITRRQDASATTKTAIATTYDIVVGDDGIVGGDAAATVAATIAHATRNADGWHTVAAMSTISPDDGAGIGKGSAVLRAFVLVCYVCADHKHGRATVPADSAQ